MTQNNDALKALDVNDIKELIVTSFLGKPRATIGYYEEKKKIHLIVEQVFDCINQHIENRGVIRKSLTEQPSVDVIGHLYLSMPAQTAEEGEWKYTKGWNDCVDHLHAQGYLRTEQAEEDRKAVRELVEVLDHANDMIMAAYGEEGQEGAGYECPHIKQALETHKAAIERAKEK